MSFRSTMMAGATSQSIPITAQNATTGAAYAGLLFNTSGLAANYRQQGQSSWTTITLVTMTLGTWVSGGFILDNPNVAGSYEFGIPNAALAAGAGVQWVEIYIYGATALTPIPILIELSAVNFQSATGFVASVPSVVGPVGSVTGAVASVAAPVNLDLSQTLNVARAVDGLADNAITLNDVFHCATGGVSCQEDASSGTQLVLKTAATGTTLRTKTLTLISPPSTVPSKAV